jgi:LysR family glycine cleavage system transcriptional activator
MQGENDIHPVRPLQFSNGLLALEAAIAGQGILLGSPKLLAHELEMGKLEVVNPAPLPCPQGYFAVSPIGAGDKALSMAFAEWLSEEVNN